MLIKSILWQAFTILIALAITSPLAVAQGKSKPKKGKAAASKAILWEPVDISKRDLYLGPGGSAMKPDLSSIELIRKEKGGTSLKYRIKDGSGRIWVAKIDKEAQPETASVRLTWALGYKSEINYLIPKLTIPGKGTFENVRLEARPENVKRKGRWDWDKNPFIGTKEFQGFKIMMAFLNNWDLKDSNTLLMEVGDEMQYAISDLGATFGDYGSNSYPIIWRFGRSINRPNEYRDSSFIKGVEGERVIFAFKGKGSKMFRDITVDDVRWLTDRLLKLSDNQIDDAFRAANYGPDEIAILKASVKRRIVELDQVSDRNLARNK